MRILLSGASGLIGSALETELQQRDHVCHRLVRRPARDETEHEWAPAQGRLPAAGLPAVDAAVHLSGYNIAAGRWTRRVKERIRDSRVQSTRLLCETLAGLAEPPATLVCASAVGYYGDRGDELLAEDAPPGRDQFLPQVCRAWEAATAPAAEAGVRVVNARLGPVLSTAGGMLPKMLRALKLAPEDEERVA